MATAQQIRDLITQTTSGSVRLRVPCEVRDEVCRYATRRRRQGAPGGITRSSWRLDIPIRKSCEGALNATLTRSRTFSDWYSTYGKLV